MLEGLDDMINGIIKDANDNANEAIRNAKKQIAEAKSRAKSAKSGRRGRSVTVSGNCIIGSGNVSICNSIGESSVTEDGMTIESSSPINVINGTVILPAGASCVISGSGCIRVATEGADLDEDYTTNEQEGTKSNERVFEITEPFSSITNCDSVDVNYTDGEEVSVKAHGNKSALSKLDIRVMGSSLMVGFKPNSFVTGHVVVDVVAPKINDFSNQGSGDTFVNSDIKDAKKCNLYTSGSGNIAAQNIDAFLLSTMGSGSGDITIGSVTGKIAMLSKSGSGETRITEAVLSDDLSISCSGSGDVELGKAEAKSIEIKVNGSADVDVDGIKADKVKASVSGSGEIRLSGKATEVEYSTTGSGEIEAGSLEAETGEAKASGSGDITANVSGKFKNRSVGSGDIENVQW